MRKAEDLREITRNELINTSYSYRLTVGKLKEFLNTCNLPDNAPVLIQRVEDVYYDDNNWGVYFKENEYTEYTEAGEVLKDTLAQYHPAHSCVKYKDEGDILFIDLHY